MLSDATVKRILGTLKAFYGWLWRSGCIVVIRMTQLPKLAEPEADDLTDERRDFSGGGRDEVGDRNPGAVCRFAAFSSRKQQPCWNVGDFDGSLACGATR